MNWTALIFGSTTNFIVPLVLYLASRTRSATVEPECTKISTPHLVSQLTKLLAIILQNLLPKPRTTEAVESISIPLQTCNTPQSDISITRALVSTGTSISTSISAGTIVDEEAGIRCEPDNRFKAFPQRRWWKSPVVAKVTLGFVTAVVVGNLIYAIVATARGHSVVEDMS